MALESTYLGRLKEVGAYYIGGTYRQMNEKAVFLSAQAIAFKVLVSIVPVIILSTGIVGRILRGDQAFQSVSGFIRNLLPEYRSEELIRSLEQLQRSSDVISLIGVIGLILAAMTLFTTLRVVIASVFQEEWHETRTILGGYLFDVRMAAQVGFLFLLSMGLSVVMQSVNAAGYELLESIGLNYPFIREGWGRIFTLFGLLLPLLLTIAMFFQLFYFVPKPHPPKRSALIGAFVTAVLWELAKYCFTFYATRVGFFRRFGSVPEESIDGAVDGAIPAAVGNTFGLIIAFVFWIYYSGVVLIIGAIVALLHEKRQRVLRKREHVEQLKKESPPRFRPGRKLGSRRSRRVGGEQTAGQRESTGQDLPSN